MMTSHSEKASVYSHDIFIIIGRLLVCRFYLLFVLIFYYFLLFF